MKDAFVTISVSSLNKGPFELHCNDELAKRLDKARRRVEEMDKSDHRRPVIANVLRRAGEQLAELGGRIYCLADRHPEIEGSEDFNQMMFYLNKLSYRLIQGKERDAYRACDELEKGLEL